MKKLATVLAAFALASVAFAQEAGNSDVLVAGLKAIGAGLALGLGAIGTGIAQGRIGAAAAGVTAESPEKFGQMLIWFVIPETLVIFGFVGLFLLR
ncbi:ATP synthase subunit K [Deinococcus misasensis]|uniref:ATP synthase subunit K n=1 Tax=Deinococcus misasensis TaxID=392413 RepID=UPI0005591D7E|nr:ATP synthase subunit K [Deinococcus misasensis]